MPPTERVQLVIADVDGTLVTQEKVLTERARKAVDQVLAAGIAFTITSGRPPLGIKMLIDPLALKDPIAAFNGGVIVRPDLSLLRQHLLPSAAARSAAEIIAQHGLDLWLYTDQDWFIRRRDAPHVAREEWTVKFPPKVAPSYDGLLTRAAKLAGVSDDYAAVARCEQDVKKACGDHVSASRSQPYYLDVTHPQANKGEVVTVLSEMLKVPPEKIATIGDGPNDVLMFRRSGVSIAMGNANEEVQKAAKFVTASNQEEGFAQAMERFVLA
ncbi:MAG TPA: HAD family hydrolase [Terriglobales bacterium]|nr:HAD family hydrolase [Terriglobales bacterium]